jgi:hypothetical protein
MPRLALIALLAGCATASSKPDPSARIAVAATTPAAGATIGLNTKLQVVADYSYPGLERGKDRILVFFKTAGGGVVEASRYVLSKPQGQVTFDVYGDILLWPGGLARPLQLELVLARWEGPDRSRPLARSQAVSFQADEKSEPVSVPTGAGAKASKAVFLPPSVGKGQLISDLARDPRYRPRLPPELNIAGMVVWGLFKLCVDPEGAVYDVTILKSADRLVDREWAALLGTLKHKPYTIGGKAVSYCYPMRLEVRSIP